MIWKKQSSKKVKLLVNQISQSIISFYQVRKWETYGFLPYWTVPSIQSGKWRKIVYNTVTKLGGETKKPKQNQTERFEERDCNSAQTSSFFISLSLVYNYTRLCHWMPRTHNHYIQARGSCVSHITTDWKSDKNSKELVPLNFISV